MGDMTDNPLHRNNSKWKGSDSMTGELLAAAVDKRAGGMSAKVAAKWGWGDIRLAFDYWAQKISQRLVDLRQGKPID
jgi:hypothetical protein